MSSAPFTIVDDPFRPGDDFCKSELALSYVEFMKKKFHPQEFPTFADKHIFEIETPAPKNSDQPH